MEKKDKEKEEGISTFNNNNNNEADFHKDYEVICISDIHFGAVSLKSIETLLATLEARPSIRVIIFAGDLTQDSLAEEFDLATKFFDELIARNIIVVMFLNNC